MDLTDSTIDRDELHLGVTDIPQVMLEKILIYLSPSDCCRLAQTCKLLHERVEAFCHHMCIMLQPLINIEKFFEHYDWKWANDAVYGDAYRKIETRQCSFTWLYRVGLSLKGRMRKSICSSQIYQPNDIDNTLIVRDHQLQRDIVQQKKVYYWIQCVHTFHNVQPGMYTMKLRMKAANVLNFAGGDIMVYFTASWMNSSGTKLVIEKHISSEYENLVDGSDEEWFFLSVEEIHLMNQSDVIFDFAKNGEKLSSYDLYFDYVELQKV